MRLRGNRLRMLRVIRALSQKGPMYASTNYLINELCLSRRTVLQIMHDLSEWGFISVDRPDNNRRLVCLTEKGVQILHGADPVRDAETAKEGANPAPLERRNSTPGSSTDQSRSIVSKGKVIPIRKEPEPDRGLQKLFSRISPASVVAITDAYRGGEGAPAFEGLSEYLQGLVRTEYPGAVFMARSGVG